MATLSLNQSELRTALTTLLTHQVKDIDTIYSIINISNKLIKVINNSTLKRAMKSLFNLFLETKGIPTIPRYKYKGVEL